MHIYAQQTREADMTDAYIPHARESAPWSWCGLRSSSDFGTVFVTEGSLGALVVWFNRKATDHAMTITSGDIGSEIIIDGRRFDVVRLPQTQSEAA